MSDPTATERLQEIALEGPIIAVLRQNGTPMSPWDVMRQLKQECRVASRVPSVRATRACRTLAARGILREVGDLRYEVVDGG